MQCARGHNTVNMEKLGYCIKKIKITKIVEDKEREIIYHKIKFKFEDHKIEHFLTDSKKYEIWINKVEYYYQCPTCFTIIRETQSTLENNLSESYPWDIEIQRYVNDLCIAKLEALKKFLQPKKLDEVKEIPPNVQPCN